MAQYKDAFQIRHNDLRPGRGKILIAEPFLRDIYFQRSVILLIEHGVKGSMGFILNKPTLLLLNHFFAELSNRPDICICLGGPVGVNQLFFIHALGPEIIPDAMKIGEQLYFGGDLDAMRLYLANDNPIDGFVKFFLGYSGWESNQLNTEIVNNSWLISRASSRSILSAHDETFWNHNVERMGEAYAPWLNFPKHPEMN